MNQIDLPTWLKLTNTKGLEAVLLAEIVEASHDIFCLYTIQMWGIAIVSFLGSA